MSLPGTTRPFGALCHRDRSKRGIVEKTWMIGAASDGIGQQGWEWRKSGLGGG
jgi:hypothetical protein